MKNIYFLTIVLLTILNNISAQNRIYVSASALGGNNGSSWANAFTYLQVAVQSAQTGDEIWVAEGTYLPTADTNRDSSFCLPSGVKLYGGFAGIETDLGQRDWQAHPSVLSGDIGLSGDSTDNSYTILFLDNPDSLTVVDGFVFRFGNANYPFNDRLATSTSRSGGAIYIMADWEAFATVSNCRFERNIARNHGGAVYVNGAGSFAAAPTFKDCVFEHNIAGQDGGGIARVGNSDIERPDFVDCTFRENKASRNGGGLYFQDANADSWLDVQGCIFVKNQGLSQGGGAVLRVGRSGGGMARVKDCRFEENSTPSVSGALSLLNQAGQPCQEVIIQGCVFLKSPGLEIQYDIFNTLSSTLLIHKSRFEDHFASSPVIAGDIVSNLIFEEDTIVNLPNASFAQANGDIKTHFDKTIFRNIRSFGTLTSDTSLFTNVLIESSNFPSGLAIVSNLGTPIQFFSCNLVGCDFNYLIYPVSGSHGDGVGADFNNCLFSNSSVSYPNIINHDTYITLKDCSLQNASFCDDNQPNDLYNISCPNNLFNLDPLFRDTANHDYSLLPCSPLINAGSNAAAAGILTDLAGNPRIQGGTIDIGAYEAPAFSLAAEPLVAPACAGDSNGSISISPVFGCEPYSYDWSPAAGNGPELNGLPPGNYLLTITDGSGRQILDTVSVSEAPVPVLNPVASDVQCGTILGGSLAANVSGGTAPFQYQWLPSAADTSKIGHLSPGTYALTVIDGNGCQDSASASIALQGMLTLMVDGQSIPCYGQTGWLSGLPATGAAPFSWLWQGWPGTDSIAQPLGPGLYAVTVSDAFGCTASFAFPPMNQPDSLWATVGTQDQTDPNMPNGAAVVTTISGGTSPYEYLWEPGGSTTQAISGLTAGNYMVTVTDKNGCEAVVEVVVDSMIVGTGEAAGLALMMYPNPAVDWVKVVFPNPFPGAVLELSDVSGRVLRSTALADGAAFGTVDLNGLPGGNYVVVVRNSGGKELFVGKVTKI